MASSGNTVPIGYGYVWGTGQKLQYNMLQNTGSDALDYTRIGFWLLGEGEWDGLEELWDSVLGILYYDNELEAPGGFNFHTGGDAVIGSGFATTSVGPDQGCDSNWPQLVPGLQPLHYNRWAYYTMQRKQVINGITNPTPSNSSQFTDLNPIGLWRAGRCRIFSNTGSMVGYAWTRNPAWHFVDLLCRRKLFPEYNITLAGAQDLPAAVKARFDWGAIYTSAEYFGEILASGMPRFCGDYLFAQKTTLQACITQILTCSRSYLRERAGQFSITADQPRPSVFTFTRKNASITQPDSTIITQANLYNGVFKDLLIPAAATIASIAGGTNVAPVVTTQAPHCFQAKDYIVIGNTGTAYDSNWQVTSVPAVDANGNVYQFTMQNKGSNYPANVGAGGLVGLRYSRFKDRTPQFEHRAHQLMSGAAGVGIQRYRNRRSVDTDFANNTWDQVSRVSYWQRAVALGADQQPYITPALPTVQAGFFEADGAGSGAIAGQVEPGDHVTVDSTLSTAYAGEYEVVKETFDLPGSGEGQGTARSAKPGGCSFYLRPYGDSNYPDTSPVDQPGVVDVPGLPSGNLSSTSAPLADGGSLSFFTGSGPNGTSFNIPDGYAPANFLSWGSPQGFVQVGQHMHFIQQCDATADRTLILLYNDSEDAPWGGDLNFSGIAWRGVSSVSTYTLNGIRLVELTLLGGEVICFGKGFLASGTAVQLPPGYSWPNAIALGFPYMASDSGHPAHGFCAFVQTDNTIHHLYWDGSGNSWQGQAQAFVCAWKNNMGTWKASGNGWFSCPLPNGQTFAVMGASILDPSCNGVTPTTYPTTSLFQVLTGGKIPALAGMPAATLQTMTGPNGFQITGNDAHGVHLCAVDAQGNSSCTFEDGEGNVWQGSAGVFGLLCDTPS